MAFLVLEYLSMCKYQFEYMQILTEHVLSINISDMILGNKSNYKMPGNHNKRSACVCRAMNICLKYHSRDSKNIPTRERLTGKVIRMSGSYPGK